MDITALTYNVHGLPWISCPVQQIAAWILTRSPDVVCIQELFRPTDRAAMRRCLEAGSYTVVEPLDEIPAALTSGLLTAFKSTRFRLKHSTFRPFFCGFLEDLFANKGFHVLVLEDPAHRRHLRILNTHLQSNVELTALLGFPFMNRIRRKQCQQIVEHLEEDVGIPTLVVGDLNMHEDPHTKLRILHDSKKVTFPSTGENLDHVGWLPLEWVRDAACLTCATLGPRCVSCRVHTDIWWSDHHPVEYTIYLPLHQRGRGLG